AGGAGADVADPRPRLLAALAAQRPGLEEHQGAAHHGQYRLPPAHVPGHQQQADPDTPERHEEEIHPPRHVRTDTARRDEKHKAGPDYDDGEDPPADAPTPHGWY